MKRLLCFIISFSFLLLNSCYDTKQIYFLNANGAGNVKIDLVFAPFSFDQKSKDPDKQLKSAVKDILLKSKGIETWSDVSYNTTEDGKVHFVGTAYFTNLSALSINGADMMKASLIANSDGSLSFELKEENKSKKIADTGKLSDEERKKRIAKSKSEFQQSRGMMAAFLLNLRHENIYFFPGKVEKSSNLKTLNDGSFDIVLSGKLLLEALDSLASNQSFYENQVDHPEQSPFADFSLNEKLFGSKAPVVAKIAKPVKDLFDYASEVKSAASSYQKILESLSISPTASPTGSAGKIKSSRIIAVNYIAESDSEKDITPFQSWNKGYSLVVLTEFDGAAIKVELAQIDSVKTDTGEELVLDEESDRKASFPHLSKDKTSGFFEFRLKLPADNTKSLKQVTGKITYLAATTSHLVDLGFPLLASGQKGKQLGANLTSIKPSSWDAEQTELTFQIKTPLSKVKKYVLTDASGQAMEFEKSSESDNEDESEVTLRVKGKIPAKGKLSLDVFDDTKQYEAPFKIENVSLFGKPL